MQPPRRCLDPNQLMKGINKTLFLAARLELGKESRDNDRMLNTSRPFDLEGQLQNWDLRKGSKRLGFKLVPLIIINAELLSRNFASLGTTKMFYIFMRHTTPVPKLLAQ